MTMPISSSSGSHSVDRWTFEELYSGPAPWEIGKPQPRFVAVADQVAGPVLDAGCGTGEHALFLAARGLQVVGLDFVDEAIRRARWKAAERDLGPQFLVKDVTALWGWAARFASVIDCGLFHVLSDADRTLYIQGLTHVLEPGGRLFLMCFSDNEPGTEGPRRVSRRELYEAFANGWDIESVEPCQIEVNPQFTELKFSEGGPKAWFAIVRRQPCAV